MSATIHRARPRRNWGAAALGFVRAQPVGAAALLAIILFALAAILAGHLAPYDPVEIDFAAMLSPPSPDHPFGTDSFGRDILTRIIYGARTALSIGLLSSLLGCSAGAAIGLLSAYWGGRADMIIQRFVDVILSFPIIVLAMVVVAVLGQHAVGGIDINLIAAIAIPVVPNAERVIRAAALGLRRMAYIDAAQVAGFSATRIIFRHLAPNVVAPFIVMVTAYIAQAILLEASLSFLGLGITDPTPAWGLMLAGDSTSFYQEAPWMILFPGAAISLAVFAFNLFGDALRDWLDPRLRL